MKKSTSGQVGTSERWSKKEFNREIGKLLPHLETAAVLRKIASCLIPLLCLPSQDRFRMHIFFRGSALLFLADMILPFQNAALSHTKLSRVKLAEVLCTKFGVIG